MLARETMENYWKYDTFACPRALPTAVARRGAGAGPRPATVIQKALDAMGNELFLSSSRIIPSGLIDAGFKFKFSSLSDFLKSSA